jgi:hypothetical protein
MDSAKGGTYALFLEHVAPAIPAGGKDGRCMSGGRNRNYQPGYEYPGFVKRMKEFVHTRCVNNCSEPMKRRALFGAGIPVRRISAIFGQRSTGTNAYKTEHVACDICQTRATQLFAIDFLIYHPEATMALDAADTQTTATQILNTEQPEAVP